MRKKIFTFLLALAASVGMSWATGLQVVEVTSDLYAEWQWNTDPFTVDALPGFQTVTLDEAKTWTGAPTSGGAYLVFSKDDVNNSIKTVYFENGNFVADVEMMPGTTLNQLYNDLTTGGHYFYTVSSGGSTPTELQVTELEVPGSWNGDYTHLTASDFPGFVAASAAEAQAWSGAPASGSSCLIYAFEDDEAKVCYFEDGVFSELGARTDRDDIYYRFDQGYQIYYTGTAPVYTLLSTITLQLENSQFVENHTNPNVASIGKSCNVTYAQYANYIAWKTDPWSSGEMLLVMPKSGYTITKVVFTRDNNPSNKVTVYSAPFTASVTNNDNISKIEVYGEAETPAAPVVVASWTSNECNVVLTNDGKLTVSKNEGDGEMEDMNYYQSSKWRCFSNLVTSVEIQEGVTRIGDYAFYNMQNISSVSFPNSLLSIGDGAFFDCPITGNVVIPEHVETIGSNAFAMIGQSASTVSIPASVTSIGQWAFQNKSTEDITSTNVITAINVDAANPNYCSVDGILYSKDMTTLIAYPAGKTATEYVIPSTVTEIKSRALYSCVYITTLTIPAGTSLVEYDGYAGMAFSGCYGLTDIYNYATTPQTISCVLSWMDKGQGSINLYVPSGTRAAYEAADGWKDLNIIDSTPAPTPVGPVADLSKAIAIDLRSQQLGGDGSTGGAKYLIIDSEDNYTYVDDEPAAYNAYFAFENFNGTQHGYTNLLVNAPVEAGKYLLTLGGCQYGTGTGNVKNASSEILAEFDQKTAACYNGNPAQNTVSMIFTVDAAQTITIDCGNWTPYIALKKMPEIPVFTDFEINFQTNPYSMISGAKPEGTVIIGTYHDNLHGYQNVEAVVPVKAGNYRLTVGACEYSTNSGNVMSETNVELASFNQNLGKGNCYHNNPVANIVSTIFTVDIDQTITIDCGQYTPYMKLEKITAYHVVFALGDAEGVAPAAADVTIGEAINMPVNKTMYKEGYTLTGWSDGANSYAIGEAFTPANDVVLTPVFTENAENALQGTTVKWFFGTQNGAPEMHIEGNSGYLIAQATDGNKTVDVKLSIDATSGKFKNTGVGDARWAQVNANTVLTFPSAEGATVNVWVMNEPTESTLDGATKTSWENNIATYDAAPTAGTSTYTVLGNATWYGYIEVTYPASTPAPTDEQVPTNADPENPSYHYSTFFHSTQNYKLTNDGTQAFIADLSGNDLVLTKIAEGAQVIPANTAVILRKSGSADPVVLTPTEENGVSVNPDDNSLEGVDVATLVTDITGLTQDNCYVLSGTDQYGVGFYRINGNTLKAHKAYVKYAGLQNNAPRRMRFVFENEQIATGVDNTEATVESQKIMENGQVIIIRNGVRYNVQGQIVK